MIKYLGYTVSFQEVPYRTTLCFNITNCPHRCPGCHSPELQQDIGQPLLPVLSSIIEKYRGGIDCVCFMGEGNDYSGIRECLEVVKALPGKRLETCLYTGDMIVKPEVYIMIDNFLLDYIKIGRYVRSMGGLDSPVTNQRMFRICRLSNPAHWSFEDITHCFTKERIIKP